MGSCLTLDRRGESAGTGVRVRAGPTGELGGVAVTRGRVRMVGGGPGGARLWGLGSLPLRQTQYRRGYDYLVLFNKYLRF